MKAKHCIFRISETKISIMCTSPVYLYPSTNLIYSLYFGIWYIFYSEINSAQDMVNAPLWLTNRFHFAVRVDHECRDEVECRRFLFFSRSCLP